jgi:2-polyprenyl-3-methyl-5-hydroxy-6-metoxy-1,4-benzoquinol methylase
MVKTMIRQDIIYDNIVFGKYDINKFNKFYPHIKNNLKNTEEIKVLDVGGGEGHLLDLFLTKLKEDFNNNIYINFEFHIIDISKRQVEMAKKKGYNAIIHDISKGFPYNDESFDIIFASEVIEHIFDTSYFLKECCRILKKDGLLILTTPNIASLGNRINLFLGNKPGCIDYRVENSPGHIRVFTIKNIVELLNDAGFKIIKITGFKVNTYNSKKYGKINLKLGDLFPTLSDNIITIVKK